MKTEQEILDAMADMKWKDLFGTRMGDIMEGLSFEKAKPWLKETAKPEDWTKIQLTSDKQIYDQAVKYLDFAQEKIDNQRGLSANRSMYHYQAWLWLMNAPQEIQDVAWRDYDDYGQENLNEIRDWLMSQKSSYTVTVVEPAAIAEKSETV